MAITHDYTLICDDIRREDSGKLILVGVYTPDIVTTQIPFVLPSFSVLQRLQSDRPGEWHFRFKLAPLETGKAIIEGMGQAKFAAPGSAYVPFKFGAVQFP